MARFRSSPGARYYHDLTEYRQHAIAGGTAGTSLFEIVDQLGAFNPGETRFPWITFVLGSGCLAPTIRADELDGHEIALLVRNGLASAAPSSSEIQHLLNDDLLVGRVGVFADALITKKIPNAEGKGWLQGRAEASEPSVISWPAAAIATLVACCATSLYVDIARDASYVMDRADKEVLRISHADRMGDSFANLNASLDAALAFFDAYADGMGSSGLSQSVAAYQKLLESARRTMLHATQSGVWRVQVEALTGFAWHFLTDGSSIYPGWTDMLLFQAADTPENAAEFERVPFLPRPVFQDSEALRDGSVLLERLRRVTERSHHVDDGVRDRFYDQVAQILIQQAREAVGGGTRHPLATAFVASFDVELELALWKRLADDVGAGNQDLLTARSFAIVAPVYVTYDANPRDKFNTDLHWLWRKVTPRPEVDALDIITRPENRRHPDSLGPWQQIDNSLRSIPETLRGLPIVIRLAGAPLVHLDLDAADLFGSDVYEVQHALLLNEHLATSHFAEDILNEPGPGQLHGEFLRSSDSHGPTAPRFWAFIGTQLSDPAIRLRLIANDLRALRNQQAFESTVDASQMFPQGQEQRGVVLNDWVPAAEREIFRWHGYPVVRGKASDLVEDLQDFCERASRRSRHRKVATNA